MPIRAICGQCRGAIRAPDKAAGRTVRCPKCKALITIPTSVEWNARPGNPAPEPTAIPATNAANADEGPARMMSGSPPGVHSLSSAHTNPADVRPSGATNITAKIVVIAGGALSLVLVLVMMGIGLYFAFGGEGKSPSTDSYENTLNSMAAEIKKIAAVDAKKNQMASKQAEKEMLARLGKNNGKEQTWIFEVSQVTLDKVSFHNRYAFFDDGSWIPEREHDLFGNFVEPKRAASKVGELTCFVFAQAKSPRRDFSDGGTYFEIGNGKLISPGTAELLAKGDFVTIKGKVHLDLVDSGSRGFELHFVETQVVDTAKRTTGPGKQGSEGATAGCAACGGCGTACCGGGVALILAPIAIFVLVGAPMIVGMWKSFEKAGESGWAALVPLYNLMIMAKIAGMGECYALLVLIPIAGAIFQIIIIIEFCKKFDVGGGFAAGVILLPFVFWPILGFGSSRYIGGGTGNSRL